MSNRRFIAAAALLFVLAAGTAWGADEEGCLFCHRYALRKDSPSGRTDLRVQDGRGGAHDALHCSDCHVEARTVPHPSTPGPAACIGECHGGKGGASPSHRRASYGALTEVHRAQSAPLAPCLLCHGADDRPGDRGPVARRCGGCHPKEREAIAAGVHRRVFAGAGAAMCPECHRAHQGPPVQGSEGRGKTTSCDGKSCHASVSPGMMRLGGHATAAGGKMAGGLVLCLAGLAWLCGRPFGAGRRRAQ